MLQVLRHGDKIRVLNPATRTFTEMIKVTFVEIGRSGAISSMSGSTDFLNRLTGQDTGLDQTRTHTHPIKADKINLFPLGKKIEGHINRKLFSTAQMAQQEHVEHRMVDGRPTFFTTYLDEREKPDEDYRMTNETLATINPDAFRNVRLRATEVDIIEHIVEGPQPFGQGEEPAVVLAEGQQGNETLGQ